MNDACSQATISPFHDIRRLTCFVHEEYFNLQWWNRIGDFVKTLVNCPWTAAFVASVAFEQFASRSPVAERHQPFLVHPYISQHIDPNSSFLPSEDLALYAF